MRYVITEEEEEEAGKKQDSNISKKLKSLFIKDLNMHETTLLDAAVQYKVLTIL